MLIELKNTILKMKHLDNAAPSGHFSKEPRPHETLNMTEYAVPKSEDGDQTRAVLVLNLDSSMPDHMLKEGLIGLFSIYGTVTSVEMATPFPGISSFTMPCTPHACLTRPHNPALSTCQALVVFQQSEDALSARRSLQDFTMWGRPLALFPAPLRSPPTPPPSRPAPPAASPAGRPRITSPSASPDTRRDRCSLLVAFAAAPTALPLRSPSVRPRP
jgi:hypothetical protein